MEESLPNLFCAGIIIIAELLQITYQDGLRFIGRKLSPETDTLT